MALMRPGNIHTSGGKEESHVSVSLGTYLERLTGAQLPPPTGSWSSVEASGLGSVVPVSCKDEKLTLVALGVVCGCCRGGSSYSSPPLRLPGEDHLAFSYVWLGFFGFADTSWLCSSPLVFPILSGCLS